MKGPAAPRDPEKKRPFFYIVREKDIFGTRQEDGRGIQYLYQSDGRLINSAEIVGNIVDKSVLGLLATVEGFHKLVHSIGVSVETQDPKEQVEFIFQMYGRTDTYGGGSNLVLKLTGNGAEQKIYVADVLQTQDDKEPGQIKIIMDKPERMAKASIRLYLNDGFTAPDVVSEETVDFHSKEYKNMIARSLLQTGNTFRLKKAMSRARQGEAVTVAYIGGSITQGAGATPVNTECYAYKSYCQFAERFGKGDNVRFVKAGVGGTPSELGMVRFDRDVMGDGILPDVVIVEFAVNDEGDETRGDCYESLVRKILKLPNSPAVILLFSVFANDDNLEERLIPIGKNYALPMVSIKRAVTPQFFMKKGEGRVLSKNQFFYDMFHPDNDGHTIMADCLEHLFMQVDVCLEEFNEDKKDETEELLKRQPVVGNTFEAIRLLDKKQQNEKFTIDCGGFTQTDENLQCVEMNFDLQATPQFPYNWMFDGQKTDDTAFKMRIRCRALVMVFKDSGETDAARADIFVDGQFVRKADPFVNGWLHCNPIIVIWDSKTQWHELTVQIAAGDEKKKFTILGFGYVE